MMFDERYEVFLADNATAREIHHKVRYQVYCLEEGFEDQNEFDDSQERDEWDDRSAHFTVRDKRSGEWVAAMRLILPLSERLPIEEMCDIEPGTAPAGEAIGEISRMCIVDKCRRKTRSHSPTHGDSPVYPQPIQDKQAPKSGERVHKSEIILGLLRAAIDYSYEHGISRWYFLTTPALARIVNRLCIQLTRVGSPCDHRGVRYPFAASLKEAERQATEGSSTIAEWRKGTTNSYRRYSDLQRPAFDNLQEGLVA
jgi:N-acyl amino acid synthase of PEP-CTERM/exosortase system